MIYMIIFSFLTILSKTYVKPEAILQAIVYREGKTSLYCKGVSIKKAKQAYSSWKFYMKITCTTPSSYKSQINLSVLASFNFFTFNDKNKFQIVSDKSTSKWILD